MLSNWYCYLICTLRHHWWNGKNKTHADYTEKGRQRARQRDDPSRISPPKLRSCIRCQNLPGRRQWSGELSDGWVANTQWNKFFGVLLFRLAYSPYSTSTWCLRCYLATSKIIQLQCVQVLPVIYEGGGKNTKGELISRLKDNQNNPIIALKCFSREVSCLKFP